MSHPKEPQFFAADELAKTGMRYPDDMEHYLALFEEAGDATRAGEASTRYFEDPNAPHRIHEFQPDARIVIMLRNPISMMHSLHAMRVTQGLEPIADFEQALSDEKNRSGFGIIGDQTSVRYRDRARFSEILPNWIDTFGRDRVHVVLLEEMADDPATEFRGVLEFLGVDPTYLPPSFDKHNVSRRQRSSLLSKVHARLPYRVAPRTAGERLATLLSRVVRRLNKQRGERAAIRPELRRQLQHEFAADAQRLGELLGKDVAQLWWRRPPRVGAVGAAAEA